MTGNSPSKTIFVVTGCLALVLTACSTAKIVSDIQPSPEPMARPVTIYVSDFELANGAVQSEGLLAQLPPFQWKEQSQAQSLAATLRDDVVADLTRKGLAAQPLAPGDTIPSKGWLVRGTIEQMEEGNRLRRAIIGFGNGGTDLKVSILIDDLSSARPPALLEQFQTNAQSGKGPGAVVTLNPYVAAVKFALSGRDLGENTSETATQITDQVVAHVGAAAAPQS